MKKLKKIFNFCVLLFSVLVFSAGLSAAQTTAPAIEPKADKILRQMSKHMGSLEQFTFHTENTADLMLQSGQKLQVSSAVDLYVRRPDKLRADLNGDIRRQQFFYDGNSITLFGKRVNYYATAKAPASIEAALDHAMKSFKLVAPLSDIVYRNSYEILTANVISGIYAGLHNVHGIESHHLLFTQEDIDWQIWIENSETPLPRKIIITEKWVTGSPQFTALLTDWDVSPKLEDSLFTFVPPDNAEKIEFLTSEKN